LGAKNWVAFLFACFLYTRRQRLASQQNLKGSCQVDAVYAVTQTDGAPSGITKFVAGTNGLTSVSVLYLQRGGVIYTNTLVSYGSASASNSLVGTFTKDCFAAVVSGAWGVVAQPGSSIYEMTPATAIIVGVGTKELS
jgi:hypothetical protein